MVRGPCIDKNTGVKKGAWSEEEDNKLRAYVQRYGHWNWRQLPKFADLNRCGKSCRLRWMNYLKPGVRRGNYTPQEEGLIRELHTQIGNKWSVIATKLPGRTDNDIKNHWHSHLVGMKVKADHSKSKDPEETKFEMNEEESSTLDEEPSSSSVSTSRSMELRIYL